MLRLVNPTKVKIGLIGKNIFVLVQKPCYNRSMNIKTHQTQIRTLRRGDSSFIIRDGVVHAPRAGFEISDKCPKEYRLILSDCINRQWIEPVAYITERELLFMGLTSDQ